MMRLKGKYIYIIYSQKNNSKSFRLTKQVKNTGIFKKVNQNNNR